MHDETSIHEERTRTREVDFKVPRPPARISIGSNSLPDEARDREWLVKSGKS